MVNDAWLETCKVSISAQGGADVSFETLIDTIDFSGGEKGVESKPTLAGGRIVTYTPETDTEVTMEAYPRDVGTDTGSVGKGFFDLLHTSDITQPMNIPSSRTRNKYRLVIAWTDAAVPATGACSTPTNEMKRWVGADGYFTVNKESFTDGVLKATITFKVAPFDKTGAANINNQSITGSQTSTLTALAAYTSTVKW